MPTPHPSTVSTTIAGKSFTASAEPPQSNLAERIYWIIDDLCQQASGPVWLSQKDLAQTLEVTPRTINRAIARLKESGRLIVTKNGADLSYLTAREPAQLPMVAAITPAPSQRTRSRADKPASPPRPSPTNRSREDTHTMADGQPIDPDTTVDGQPIDQQWSANGQPMDLDTTADGHLIDALWSANGSAMVSPETPDSQPVDSPTTSDGQSIDDPSIDQASTVWKQALADIRSQVPPGSFREFFAPSVGIKFDGDSLVVAVQNPRASEWLERPLHQEIAQTALEHAVGRELSIKYLIDPTIAVEIPHDAAPAPKAPLAPLELSPCPSCGPDTMTRTTWPSLKRLSGETYYCRAAGACSRLWNSVVGEFHPPGDKQLGPEAARDLLNRVLQNRPRSHH